MSEYMMMPGARLEIGPGGKPYETLGAVPVAPCCSACAKGGRRCGALGSDSAVFDLVTNPLVLVAAGVFVWWKFFGGSESRVGTGARTAHKRAKHAYQIGKGAGKGMYRVARGR
jgi:hypothetical protein